jgi:hypothetical protein
MATGQYFYIKIGVGKTSETDFPQASQVLERIP